jgi:hypothetical protein
MGHRSTRWPTNLTRRNDDKEAKPSGPIWFLWQVASEILMGYGIEETGRTTNERWITFPVYPAPACKAELISRLRQVLPACHSRSISNLADTAAIFPHLGFPDQGALRLVPFK